MNDLFFTLTSMQTAIAHIDADAFFASCEEVIHPELKGKPIVTGAERGIIACASYPAKALGIKRGITLRDAKKLCPQLVILPSDYETYSLFSRRMFAVMRRFTPDVEEYSVDEAFCNLRGMRRCLKGSYEDIARRMQAAVKKELGVTVSVGLSLTKVLAKIASKWKKPEGFTIIRGREIPRYLQDVPIGKVWGIGPATTAYLNKHGVKTALDFARWPEEVVKKRLTKPGREIWQELRGVSVLPVSPEAKTDYATITKSRTFAPASDDEAYVYAHLLRNLESACIKARRYKLAAKKIVAYLRMQDFSGAALEMKLDRPSNCPLEMAGLLHGLFLGLFKRGRLYRATGVVLLDLCPDANVQYSLFEDPLQAVKVQDAYAAMDQLSGRYGKHVVHLGASHLIEVRGRGRRGEPTAREQTRFLGETKRKHLGLPLIHLPPPKQGS